MAKVIKFPENKSKKAQEFRRAEGRRVFLTLSMVSLVLVAVFLNDQMLRSYRPVYVISENSTVNPDSGRAIASEDTTFTSDNYRDLKWEKQLAERLRGDEHRQPAAISQGVSLLDQMRYGDLEGHYSLDVRSSADGRAVVIGLSYKDSSSAGGDPIYIHDGAEFLSKYVQLFGGHFESVSEKRSTDQQKVFSLLSSNKVVGEAEFRFDMQGRLMSLQFRAP